MKIASVIFFLFTITLCKGQTTETRFYRDRVLENEVQKDHARYSQTVSDDNGIKTEIIKDLKKNEVVFSESWKGDEPVGTWVGLTGKGPETRDYNFELVYENESCSNASDAEHIEDWQNDNVSLGYKAPLIMGEKNLITYVVKNLRYPAIARRQGINGTVHLEFILTKEGTIENIVVTKGVHIMLDKEAVRLIRGLKLSSPPMLNGQPCKVCAKFPLRYKLA
jgi:TonB family protein